MEYQEKTAEDYVAILENDDSGRNITIPPNILLDMHEHLMGYHEDDGGNGRNSRGLAGIIFKSN